MINDSQSQLIEFLRNKLAIPTESLKMAVRFTESSVGSLPMILWQYGLIDLNQLDQVFDWIEKTEQRELDFGF
ncbi:DUF2949 domain-containing protein [Crocosphaera sp. XPORK-15E]|uniref:DUF2949 domain-containing protein n=1 Tax=Crocosphaera sp. XPORK-15E TaxID=3110247 RepID=UPI002B1EE651|nr:DUF2949 domain-containing protein [Crocosphaera sp. XPORK-15E]MEA5533452.1 DUF2949 domain-containing protein [Crocosphaera sp. XPORK-15E]